MSEINIQKDEKILITGYGAVTPLGIGVDNYWNNLISGKSGIDYITRFDASNLPVTFAGEVKDFNPEDFMTKKLAKEMELFMQFAFAAADEALRDAGIVPDENGNLPIARERIGIVVGSVFSGIIDIAKTEDDLVTGKHDRTNPRFITKIIGNIAAAQIAIDKGLRGPSLTVSTACSSGIDALSTGAMLIKQNLADAVICVGTEAATCPLTIQGLTATHALSKRNDDPKTASRPFDLGRDGFVMGEGSGAIIIEKESSALKRAFKIHAEVAGISNGTDGYHVTRPHPDGIGAMFCMNQCLELAGVTPDAVDYINAHGTSTKAGDVIEVSAINKLFEGRRVPVSATKASTGHLMGAAGAIEAIACIKAVEEDIMPPTINQFNQDPDCDIDQIPNEMRKAEVNYAMCNAFGFGGQNASVLIKKYK